MKLRESMFSLEALAKAASMRCYPGDQKNTAAEVYFVEPRKEVELWDSTDEPDQEESRVMITSYAGPEPVRVRSGRTVTIESEGKRVTIKSGYYCLASGSIVMERSNLSGITPPDNPSMRHIRFLVCTLDRPWNLPTLP